MRSYRVISLGNRNGVRFDINIKKSDCSCNAGKVFDLRCGKGELIAYPKNRQLKRKFSRAEVDEFRCFPNYDVIR